MKVEAPKPEGGHKSQQCFRGLFTVLRLRGVSIVEARESKYVTVPRLGSTEYVIFKHRGLCVMVVSWDQAPQNRKRPIVYCNLWVA